MEYFDICFGHWILLRGLLFIFAQTIIQKVLSFYLFKTPVSIALISALLFFVLAILTATRDYVGETQNLEGHRMEMSSKFFVLFPI